MKTNQKHDKVDGSITEINQMIILHIQNHLYLIQN